MPEKKVAFRKRPLMMIGFVGMTVVLLWSSFSLIQVGNFMGYWLLLLGLVTLLASYGLVLRLFVPAIRYSSEAIRFQRIALFKSKATKQKELFKLKDIKSFKHSVSLYRGTERNVFDFTVSISAKEQMGYLLGEAEEKFGQRKNAPAHIEISMPDLNHSDRAAFIDFLNQQVKKQRR
ncbi:MAG: hypothetical protein ACI31W_06055 [Lactococcus sp.]